MIECVARRGEDTAPPTGKAVAKAGRREFSGGVEQPPRIVGRKVIIKQVVRWVLVAAAATAAFFATLCFSFLLMLGPFPTDLAEPTSGFLMTIVTVLTGSLLAPRARIAVAVILSVLCIAFLFDFSFGIALKESAVGAIVGANISVALIAWWFHSRRTTWSIICVGLIGFLAFFGFLGLVYARYIDRPARPDALPSQLTRALGTNTSAVSAFYEYDLGGFIDSEELWRIDASPEAVALVITGLKLNGTNAVPSKFFGMPPHYWPRSFPAGAEAFQSEWFSADSRGPDGLHYLLLHDKKQGRAYVWCKMNF